MGNLNEYREFLYFVNESHGSIVVFGSILMINELCFLMSNFIDRKPSPQIVSDTLSLCNEAIEFVKASECIFQKLDIDDFAKIELKCFDIKLSSISYLDIACSAAVNNIYAIGAFLRCVSSKCNADNSFRVFARTSGEKLYQIERSSFGSWWSRLKSRLSLSDAFNCEMDIFHFCQGETLLHNYDLRRHRPSGDDATM